MKPRAVPSSLAGFDAPIFSSAVASSSSPSSSFLFLSLSAIISFFVFHFFLSSVSE